MPELNIGDITLTNSGALQGRVAFAAMQNGSGSGNGSANGVQIYQTEHVDTHNAYNNSTGIFIAPVSGVYFFYASLMGGNSDTRSVHYISKSTDGGLIFLFKLKLDKLTLLEKSIFGIILNLPKLCLTEDRIIA